jgi:hypothetical protein
MYIFYLQLVTVFLVGYLAGAFPLQIFFIGHFSLSKLVLIRVTLYIS